ncbi:MAG TPA: hypothetical protein VF668_22510 [Pyrinomonadaceae bacterium]|jgi:hypothetical protein
MKSYKHVPNLILSLGVICFTTVSIMALAGSGGKFSLTRQEPKGNPRLPRVISQVKSLEVVSVAIEGQDESKALVSIEVRNNSDKAIIAVAVESGKGEDVSGVSLNGFKAADEPPAIVLKPHDAVKVRMPLRNVHPGLPVRVASVMYADGSEDGDESALGALRRQKEHEKNSKKEGRASQE